MVRSWRTDQYRVGGKEMLEANKGRFPASVFLTGSAFYGFKRGRKGRPGHARDDHHVLQQEEFELVAETEVR